MSLTDEFLINFSTLSVVGTLIAFLSHIFASRKRGGKLKPK